MKLMPFKLIVLMLFSMLTACSARGPAFSGLQKIDGNNSAIYVLRPSQIYGSGQPQAIYINGEEKDEIKNGGYLFYKTNPGALELKVCFGKLGALGGFLLDNPKTINVNLNPKEIKYFTYSMNRSGNSLTEIKESEALLLLKELRSQ